MLGRLPAPNQAYKAKHFDHMKYKSLSEEIRTDISVAGRRDENGVQLYDISHSFNESGPIVFGHSIWIHWIKR